MSVDLARLARAIHLHAEPIGVDVFLVQSEDRSYVVRDGACECADATIRGARCKHLLACALSVLPSDVLDALRLLVPAPRAARAGVRR